MIPFIGLSCFLSQLSLQDRQRGRGATTSHPSFPSQIPGDEGKRWKKMMLGQLRLCQEGFVVSLSLVFDSFTSCKQKVESEAFCSSPLRAGRKQTLHQLLCRQEMKLEPWLGFIFFSHVSCSPPATFLVSVLLSLIIWGILGCFG